MNWNNKPAPGFAASDDDWSAGIVQRVDLLGAGLATRRTAHARLGRRRDEPGRDDRPPRRDRAGRRSPACSATAPAAERRGSRAWPSSSASGRPRGSSRLDADLDGTIDASRGGDHGRRLAAPRGCRAGAGARPARRPARRARAPRTTHRPNGNAFGSRLVQLRRQGPRARCSAAPCGGRSRPASAAAATSRRAAPRSGRRSTRPATELEAAQGPDPAAWRASAAAERTTLRLPAPLDALREPARRSSRSSASRGHRPRR